MCVCVCVCVCMRVHIYAYFHVQMFSYACTYIHRSSHLYMVLYRYQLIGQIVEVIFAGSSGKREIVLFPRGQSDSVHHTLEYEGIPWLSFAMTCPKQA